MSPEPGTPQTDKSVEREEAPVGIDIGKKEPGWETKIFKKGHRVEDGYIDLEGDGHFYWRPYPSDPDARRQIEEEREGWIH